MKEIARGGRPTDSVHLLHAAARKAFRENALGERAWLAMLEEIAERLGAEKARTPPPRRAPAPLSS